MFCTSQHVGKISAISNSPLQLKSFGMRRSLRSIPISMRAARLSLGCRLGAALRPRCRRPRRAESGPANHPSEPSCAFFLSFVSAALLTHSGQWESGNCWESGVLAFHDLSYTKWGVPNLRRVMTSYLWTFRGAHLVGKGSLLLRACALLRIFHAHCVALR